MLKSMIERETVDTVPYIDYVSCLRDIINAVSDTINYGNSKFSLKNRILGSISLTMSDVIIYAKRSLLDEYSDISIILVYENLDNRQGINIPCKLDPNYDSDSRIRALSIIILNKLIEKTKQVNDALYHFNYIYENYMACKERYALTLSELVDIINKDQGEGSIFVWNTYIHYSYNVENSVYRQPVQIKSTKSTLSKESNQYTKVFSALRMIVNSLSDENKRLALVILYFMHMRDNKCIMRYNGLVIDTTCQKIYNETTEKSICSEENFDLIAFDTIKEAMYSFKEVITY